MDKRFHTPPRYDAIGDKTPLVFLAGPIQGAAKWQQVAADSLLQQSTSLEVASPRRVSLGDTFVYQEQIDWEKKHLARSRKMGALLFWFAKQDPSEEYEPGRPYAKTTKLELARAIGWLDVGPPFTLIVGIEPGFDDEKEDKYLRSLPREKGLTIHTRLEDVITETLEKL